MFRNEGFSEFIPKPIERIVLERVLRRVLPKRCIQSDVDLVVPEEQGQKAASGEEEREKKKGTVSDVPMKEDVSKEGTAEEETAQAYGSLVRAGINVGVGLNYCSGEEEFYREMLQMFHDQAEEKRAEIVSLYEGANWNDYAIKVHALKSTALTIGAEELSSRAKELERAGKEGNEAYIHENHPLLLKMYGQVCESIKKYLS